MPKKKENILGKIVQKDYDNELEEIIETKDFEEDVKNLLLSILYKVDVSYKDYKNVKRKVETKQQYTEKIIKTIKNNCETIKIIKPNSEEAEQLKNRTFLVDSKNKKIICYPVERKLLYCISKIAKQDLIIKSKYFPINQTISDIINIGNNINTEEPVRDFNGWSWLTIRKEIENINYNLIYQNLRILIGENFLNSWSESSDFLIDYYEEFQNELIEKFGIDLKEKLIRALENLSIILEIEINPQYEKILRQLQEENEQKAVQIQDNQKFVEQLTEEKKKLNKKIKNIEKILSNKQILEQEYTKINNNLSVDEKIFSIKILEKKMKAEKQDLLEEIEQKNQLLNPKKFIQEKIKIEKLQQLLQILQVENLKKEKEKILLEIQKLFLQCLLVFIKVAETREEIVDLIYMFRYYNFLPFNEKIDICDKKPLQKHLREVKSELIKKAIDYKIITALSQNEEENIKLLQFIFQTRIISIEDIYISIIKEKEKYYVQFSEDTENSYEEKFEINTLDKENLNIKLNKKVKILS